MKKSHLSIHRLSAGALSLLTAFFWTLAGASAIRAEASAQTLREARICAAINWHDKGGYERAQAYRRQAACLKDLYIAITAGDHAEMKQEIAARMTRLETAYRQARDICGLREKFGMKEFSEEFGCGTGSLSPDEFIRLLKTMIVNEDSGWVRKDPRLVQALKLDP